MHGPSLDCESLPRSRWCPHPRLCLSVLVLPLAVCPKLVSMPVAKSVEVVVVVVVVALVDSSRGFLA